MSDHPKPPPWREALALNASTGALLGAILLVSMGTELWGPFLPKYMRTDLGAPILLVALYGVLRDGLEAVQYYLGGWIAGRLNARRGLLLFNAAPLAGLAILFVGDNAVSVFLAIPLVFVWDSLAGPAILAVVGDALPSERRAMAVSMQSLFKRIARIIAYSLNAAIVLLAGTSLGMHAAFGISFVIVLAGLAVQWRFMHTASSDTGSIIHRPVSVLRAFDPQLKRLLVSDILARWAEGMPRELVILFVTSLFARSAGLDDAAAWASFGGLLIVSQATSGITYLPMGMVASRPGLAKRPYIGWTFFFFSAYPAVLAVLGFVVLRGLVPPAFVFLALAPAFVVGGLREIGEPARKAMIVDLVPPAQKAQCIGIYWATRCVAVMAAPLVGGLIWIGTNIAAGHSAADPAGPGPFAMLFSASLFGIVGLVFYSRKFGR
jgi:hypothetical protein